MTTREPSNNRVRHKEKLHTVKSFNEGEDFVFSEPHNLLNLSLKLGRDCWRSGLRWSPWPTVTNVERRVGDFILKYNPLLNSTVNRHYDSSKLIRYVDEAPDVWYAFNNKWISTKKDAPPEKYESFNGRHVIGVFEEDYSHLKVSNSWVSPAEGDKVMRKLRTPTPIPKETLVKVFGRSTPWVEQGYTNYEFSDRRNQFILQVEWYRKNLLKLQRKARIKQKKALAEEKGISLEELNKLKRERKEKEGRIKRTQAWVEVSKDVHNTLDWLQELVTRMGAGEDVGQVWLDENCREMRELAVKLKPLSRLLKK